MSIFAIADLHLSLSVDKPMDVFGSGWQNYVERLEKHWRSKISTEDTVLIPGDISWGLSMDEALADLQFVDDLPGQKILSKGNHDLWWGTNKKVEDFLAAHGMTSMRLLKNNGFFIEGTLIAGTRGWLLPENPESKEADEKIYLREVGRLERSLADSVKAWEAAGAGAAGAAWETDAEAADGSCGGSAFGAEAGAAPRKVVMLHYPPIYDPERSNGFTETLEKYGVDLCLYGHLHGRGHQKAFEGVRNGVEYRLIAADYLQFDPIQL
ncbi:MAG: metallophosphoesterase [Clostridiales bacterium]|nr:metallophosphoesterase [Clostridiales bacterium]